MPCALRVNSCAPTSSSRSRICRLVDCVPDCIRFAVTAQATEWQRIGNQINAAMIFARADFVNVL
jgi:hypothetical protein